MFIINNVQISGRWVKDLELRYLPSTQKATTTGRLAVKDPSRKDRDGKNVTYFIDILMFGNLAENAVKFAGIKGYEVYIMGKLTSRTYKDKDGKIVYVTEILASEIQYGNAPGQAPGQKEKENKINPSNHNHLEDVSEDEGIPW